MGGGEQIEGTQVLAREIEQRRLPRPGEKVDGREAAVSEVRCFRVRLQS